MILTQPQILSFFYMVIYLLILGILYQGAKKYKEWRFVQEVLEMAKDRTEQCPMDCSILYLACHHPAFKQMNGAVSQYPGHMAIVLEGPDWFVRNKQYSWRRHHVIAAEQLRQVPVHFKNNTKLLCRRTGKWMNSEEAAQYLQQFLSEQEPQKAVN